MDKKGRTSHLNLQIIDRLVSVVRAVILGWFDLKTKVKNNYNNNK